MMNELSINAYHNLPWFINDLKNLWNKKYVTSFGKCDEKCATEQA